MARVRVLLLLAVAAALLVVLVRATASSMSTASLLTLQAEAEVEADLAAELDMRSAAENLALRGKRSSKASKGKRSGKAPADTFEDLKQKGSFVPTPAAVQVRPVVRDPSGLTPAGTTPAGGEDQSEVGLCEVCMYVLENKMQHQPYLCKGLKDPHYQNICVQVMESLMWWVSNQVYWVNYGCQMNQNGAVSWVRPCPAHAICSWLQHLYLRKPYCAPDKNFPKPA